MVRQIQITVPHAKVSAIRDVLHKQNIVHHLEVYNGETSSLIICKVVNKKTDELLQLLARYSVGIRYGHIDVVALASSKPRIATFRGSKLKSKSKKYMVTDRMSYDEMVDFIDSQIHLTFDYLALIAVGAMICAGGLLTDSAVNVVASMLVSPLMGPIVGMTFGTIVKDRKMFWVSFRNECTGLFTCWICGVLIGFLVGTFFDAESVDGPMSHGTEMQSRGTLKGLAWGIGIAIPSGLGVALGVSSYTISALIGVAISAALLPPIVNSGLCLGASFIMYFVPSQSNDIIVSHWVKTGVISLALFLLNWICLYLSALIMFRIKRLHYHANAHAKAEKLAQFSKMVDDSMESPFMDCSNTRDALSRFKTLPSVSTAPSIYSGVSTAAGSTSSDFGFDCGNIQSKESILRATVSYPLLEEQLDTSLPVVINQASRMLKSRSLKDIAAKYNEETLTKNIEGPHTLIKKKSASATSLAHSADIAAIQSKAGEMRLFEHPLILRKGSK